VLSGWIANGIDPAIACADANIEALRERIVAPLLGVIAHRNEIGGNCDVDALSQAARQL
jgi:dethiobiotin synthetase